MRYGGGRSSNKSKSNKNSVNNSNDGTNTNSSSNINSNKHQQHTTTATTTTTTQYNDHNQHHQHHVHQHRQKEWILTRPLLMLSCSLPEDLHSAVDGSAHLNRSAEEPRAFEVKMLHVVHCSNRIPAGVAVAIAVTPQQGERGRGGLG